MTSRRQALLILAALAFIALAVAVARFDWNQLRGPLERYASNRLEREVHIGRLDVRLGVTPVIRLHDLSIANPEWVEQQPMAHAREVEFSVRLVSLLRGSVVLPQLRLSDAKIDLRRLHDGRANWEFGPPSRRKKAVPPEVLALRVNGLRANVLDAQHDVEIEGEIQMGNDARYPINMDFSGRWHRSSFKGRAQAGSALSIGSGAAALPVRFELSVEDTNVRADGEITDLANLGRIDADFSISGPNLGNLYPTLRIALPASPPYRLRGRLRKEGNRYAYSSFSGTVGDSDIAGDGEFVIEKPRPKLTATLRSNLLRVSDLGPMVGANRRAKERAQRPPGESAQAQSAGHAPRPAPLRDAAADPPRTTRDGRPLNAPRRLLPDVDLDPGRLRAIDAEVTIAVNTLQLPAKLTFRKVSSRVLLDDARLRLAPVRFHFADGEVVANLELDGQRQPVAGSLAMDMRRLALPQLFVAVPEMKASAGRIGMRIELKGQGLSVADLLGEAHGSVAAGMEGGRISDLALAAASLNGGRLLELLVGGDQQVPIRCMGMAVNFNSGIGDMKNFVLDTRDVLVEGEGLINLQLEVFDFVFRTKPKEPNILSLRAPVHVRGTFRGARIAIDSKAMIRGGAAVALGAINPLAALLPLIETGPGEDSDCRAVLAPVQK